MSPANLPPDAVPVWLVSERRARWAWVAGPLLVLAALAVAAVPAQRGYPALGALAAAGVVAGGILLFNYWLITAATATAGPASLTVVPATGQPRTVPYGQITGYSEWAYRSMRLHLSCRDGSQLTLRPRHSLAEFEELLARLRVRLAAYRAAR